MPALDFDLHTTKGFLRVLSDNLVVLLGALYFLATCMAILGNPNFWVR